MKEQQVRSFLWWGRRERHPLIQRARRRGSLHRSDGGRRGPECEQEGSKIRQRIDYNINQYSSSVVKALLAHQMATRTCHNSRALGRFFTTHVLLFTEATESLDRLRKPYTICRLQCSCHQSTTFVNCTTCEQNTWTYKSLWILLYPVCLYGFIEHSILFLSIYIMYSWYNSNKTFIYNTWLAIAFIGITFFY